MTRAEELGVELALAYSMPPDDAATQAIAIFKEAKRSGEEAAAPYAEVMAAAKEALRGLMAEMDTRKLKTPAGQADIPRDGKTVKWDAKGLDRFVARHPDIGAMIAEFRKETTAKGSLTVR